MEKFYLARAFNYRETLRRIMTPGDKFPSNIMTLYTTLGKERVKTAKNKQSPTDKHEK